MTFALFMGFCGRRHVLHPPALSAHHHAAFMYPMLVAPLLSQYLLCSYSFLSLITTEGMRTFSEVDNIPLCDVEFFLFELPLLITEHYFAKRLRYSHRRAYSVSFAQPLMENNAAQSTLPGYAA